MSQYPQPSWKAVRRGRIYCAPACGGRCTWAAFQKATRNCRKLAKRMGPGWTTRVWENLGWHYEVISPCGRIKLGPIIHNKKIIAYSTLLGPKGEPGGNWSANASTPEYAVTLVVKEFKKYLKSLNAVAKGL